jgi:hypothetical protein
LPYDKTQGFARTNGFACLMRSYKESTIHARGIFHLNLCPAPTGPRRPFTGAGDPTECTAKRRSQGPKKVFQYQLLHVASGRALEGKFHVCHVACLQLQEHLTSHQSAFPLRKSFARAPPVQFHQPFSAQIALFSSILITLSRRMGCLSRPRQSVKGKA